MSIASPTTEGWSSPLPCCSRSPPLPRHGPYQARVWTGEQASNTSKATATRISANRVAALANRQVQVDVATFTQWLDARTVGRSELAAFYRTRFRPEFKTAFAAWLATNPFTNRAPHRPRSRCPSIGCGPRRGPTVWR